MNDIGDRLRVLARARGGRDGATVVGAAVSAIWLLLVLLFWLAGPEGDAPGGLARLVSVVGILLPLALIWMAVGLARAIADLRAEATVLRARLEAVRPPAAPDETAVLPAAPGLSAAAGARAAAGRAAPAPRAADPRRPGVATQQTDLPFDQPPPVEVSPEELVAALNFPDGPDDHVAISALRAALADPEAARTIRAAQDVVTLLAKHGVYMDDLAPAPEAPELWRRFTEGERGPALSPLAAVGDDTAVEMTTALMRGDEVFRDAAHHFLRQYDRTLGRLAPRINDLGLTALAQTRSGRAFGLLAQVTGMFG